MRARKNRQEVLDVLPHRLQEYVEAHPDQEANLRSLYVGNLPFVADREWVELYCDVVDAFMLEGIAPVMRDIATRYDYPFFSPLPDGVPDFDTFATFLVEAVHTTFGLEMLMRGCTRLLLGYANGPFGRQAFFERYSVSLLHLIADEERRRGIFTGCLYYLNTAAGASFANVEDFVDEKHQAWANRYRHGAKVLTDVPRSLDRIEPIWRRGDHEGKDRPDVRLPSFMTVEWLAGKIALSGAVRSKITAVSPKVTGACIDPSVLAVGSKNAFGDMIHDLLGEPFALTALNAMLSPDERYRESSVFRRYYSEVMALTRYDGDGPYVSDLILLSALIDDGRYVEAVEFAAVRGAESVDENFVEILESADVPGRDEVVDFLISRRRLRSWTERAHPHTVGYVTRICLEPIADTVFDIRPEGKPLKNPTSAAVDAKDLYRDAMMGISRRAERLAADDPTAEAVAEIAALADGLPALLDAYLASLPKRVDAAPVLLRAGTVREDIIGLAKQLWGDDYAPADFPGVPSLTDLSEAGATRVAVSLDRTEGHVVTVRAHMGDLQVLNSEYAVTPIALRRKVMERMDTATTFAETDIGEAQAGYREVVAILDQEGSGAETVTVAELPVATPPKEIGSDQVLRALADLDFEPEVRPAVVEAVHEAIEEPGAVNPEDQFISDFLDSVAGHESGSSSDPETPMIDVEAGEHLSADEEDVALDASDLAAMSTLHVEPVACSEEAVSEDPHIERIGERIWEFVADGKIGLGYHLATAASRLHADAELPVTPAELRFAAMAGSMNHTAIMARPEIATDAVAALYAIPGGLPAAEDDASVARRFLMYPTAVELAMFHPDSGADNVLRQLNGLGQQVKSASHALTASVQKVSQMRLELNPALLGHIGNAIDAESGATKLRLTVLDRLGALNRAKYNFMLGQRVRNHLFLPTSILGQLRDALADDGAKALATAKAYKEQYSTRAQIIEMLRQAEIAATGRYQGIDGSVRDRMVAVLIQIADETGEYVERRLARGAISENRPKITQVVAELVSHLGAARATFEAVAKEEAGRITGAAAAIVADRFLRLEALLSGNAAFVPSHGASMALHGDLPLVTGLHFGHSWYPAPYEPGEVVAALLDAPRPLLTPGNEDADFEAIYRKRVAAGSLVGARMMVQLSHRYGISEALGERLVDQVRTDAEAAQAEIEALVGRTRDAVDRVIRFGSVDRPEDANRHMSTVERVHAAKVPLDIPIEERADAIGEERIEDVRIARHLLAEVNEEIFALTDEPRARLRGEIDGLAAILPEGDVDQLRKLCEAGDLLTASEFISLAREKGSIPKDQSRIRRFDSFSGVVLPALATVKSHADGAAEAIAARAAYCGLPFDTLTDGRVEEATEILTSWRALFRTMGTVRSDNTFAARVGTLLDRLGMQSRLLDLHDLTNAQLKRFIGDFVFNVSLDADNLLLPDFGSLTDGHYRVCMTATLPTEANLADWCRTAGKFGVVLMVNDLITPERRQQFMMQNLAAKRRVILIDIASILFSLAEPEQRALTLFEMAQPYSYAAPYRDWERDQVPVEMFVGRSAELSTLYEPSGSVTVYGGRRMGKTALLRHLANRFNDPKQGILVSYIDVQGIGQGQTLTKRIWSEISRSLPSIFKTPVNEQAKVVETIQNWLSMDPRRRILVLIDEADDFVKADAAQGYVELLGLQRLMTDTRRRLKFVISGLHNVARAVTSGNDPLKHISSSPQRIGPLMGAELGDAESLVVRPFAALGMEFANRSDVWRILSHANYYPVLVQTYGRHLMDLVLEEVRRTQKPMRHIPSALVHAVFERHHVTEEVKDKFLLTLRIDQRYELIAYVVANLVMGIEAEGKVEEGITVGQIRESSMMFWPAGFASRSAMSQFDELVDEMEGLGILRRTPSNLWTLRSPAVLRLLGTRDEIDNILLDFINREVPGQFDPKSGRREIEVGDEVVASPLTLSQEREILTEATRVKVVFGTLAGGIDAVPQALQSAAKSFSDTDAQDVSLVVPRNKLELLDRISKIKVSPGGLAILIVHVNSDWEPDWIPAALRSRPVMSGSVRVVFTGRPKHLVRIEANVSSIRSNDVRIFGVEPWSQAFVDERVLKRFANMDAETRTAIVAGTGLWGSPMSAILMASNNQKVKTRLERAMAEFSPGHFGLSPDLAAICALMLQTVGSHFTREDLKELMNFDELDGKLTGIWKDTNAVLDYGLVLGIFAVSGERKGGAGAVFSIAAPLPALLQA